MAAAGLSPDRPTPFRLRGRAEKVEFHVLNRIGDGAHNAEIHRRIQVPFEIEHTDVLLVGFHSAGHRGIFTPLDSTIHVHLQTADNSKSGHVQGLSLGHGMALGLPRQG